MDKIYEPLPYVESSLLSDRTWRYNNDGSTAKSTRQKVKRRLAESDLPWETNARKQTL
jgi:hypothetical protein